MILERKVEKLSGEIISKWASRAMKGRLMAVEYVGSKDRGEEYRLDKWLRIVEDTMKFCWSGTT